MSDIYYESLRQAFPPTVEDLLIEDYITNSRIIYIQKNELLAPPGSIVNKLFFIVKGSFVRNVLTSDGDEKTVMFQSESFFNFLAATDSFLKAEVTEYLIRANEDSIVLETNQDYILKLFDENINLFKFYAFSLSEIYLVSERFRNKYLALTSEEYLRWLYEHYPLLIQNYPSKNIASFMGISREWLSKLKRKILL